MLFLALQTQWRVGVAGLTGLDYGAIEPTARLMRIPLARGRFEDLQAMEAAVLKVLAARSTSRDAR